MTEYHNPVLLIDTVDGLNINENGTYVDVTFGGGGHSKEILKRLGSEGRLLAFDQDQDALLNRIDESRFTLINENFRYLKRFLKFHGVMSIDGILADFGVSSHQFDVPERGFSTRFEATLDMRMNQQEELSAFHVVNEYSESQLKQIFWQYGELRNTPKIVRCIIDERSNGDILTSEHLKLILKKLMPPRKENKILAQIYQAIRIEVNQEIEVLKEFLLQTSDVLKKGGRLSVISYHSLEDRLVKRFIRSGLFEGEPVKDVFGCIDVPLKKVGKLIVPTEDEIKLNNRARSAKLRIAEKL